MQPSTVTGYSLTCSAQHANHIRLCLIVHNHSHAMSTFEVTHPSLTVDTVGRCWSSIAEDLNDNVITYENWGLYMFLRGKVHSIYGSYSVRDY